MIAYERDIFVNKQGWGKVHQHTVSQHFIFSTHNCKKFSDFTICNPGLYKRHYFMGPRTLWKSLVVGWTFAKCKSMMWSDMGWSGIGTATMISSTGRNPQGKRSFTFFLPRLVKDCLQSSLLQYECTVPISQQVCASR